MKIRCSYINGSDLPSDLISVDPNYYSSLKFDLLLDKDYTVYAMTLHHSYIWYYICDETSSTYPIWQPSPLFEVIDPKISRYWIYSYSSKTTYYWSPHPVWAFPEWAQNPDYYYDMLTDGSENELALFEKYKDLMDLEFSDPSITAFAQVGDENWLVCPNCIDAWESSNTFDALVKCPKCNVVMNNPRYQNKPTY